MEDAKRRGASWQSSAGSFWCFLILTQQEQPGQSPDTAAGFVQSRAVSYTHYSCWALCLEVCFFLSVWPCVLGGLDQAACSCSWEHVVQILKAMVTCVSDLLWDQHSAWARQWSSAPMLVLLQWADRRIAKRLRVSTPVPPTQHCCSPPVVVTDHKQQIWQAPVTLHFPFWERTKEFHGALNTNWWTLEKEVFCI